MNELIITDVVTLAALFLPTWISPVSSFTVLPVRTPKQKPANRHPPPPPDSPAPSSSSLQIRVLLLVHHTRLCLTLTTALVLPLSSPGSEVQKGSGIAPLSCVSMQ